MNKPTVLKSGIGTDVIFGENVIIVDPANIYGCSLGYNCFVGPFVEIQKDVTIGHDCRIQSHSFICSYVSIGNNCFISHGVKFINDVFRDGARANGDSKKYKKTIIGDYVCIGTNATILPVTIADNICIGAGSVVTHDLFEPGVYAGNPAVILKKPKLK